MKSIIFKFISIFYINYLILYGRTYPPATTISDKNSIMMIIKCIQQKMNLFRVSFVYEIRISWLHVTIRLLQFNQVAKYIFILKLLFFFLIIFFTIFRFILYIVASNLMHLDIHIFIDFPV